MIELSDDCLEFLAVTFGPDVLVPDLQIFDQKFTSRPDVVRINSGRTDQVFGHYPFFANMDGSTRAFPVFSDQCLINCAPEAFAAIRPSVDSKRAQQEIVMNGSSRILANRFAAVYAGRAPAKSAAA